MWISLFIFISMIMTEFRCRKPETLRGEEEAERRDEPETKPEEERKEEERKESGAGGGDEDDDHLKEEESNRVQSSKQRPAAAGFLQVLLRGVFGFLAAVACGMLYAAYLSAHHDRKFWFSARQELERELSFQGGSGFYYHFYKRMLAAPSFQRGLSELLVDNRTVSGETMNSLQRLFLYPELLTSFIYRVTGCQEYVEPVYFYIGTVLGLQAFCVTALFLCSWMLSGTWVSGVLAVSWYLINRQDTSAVDQAVPLRVNWALPYFSCQVAALTGFLSNSLGSAAEMFCYLTMSVSTFSFLLLWEHAHCVLFLQALCLLLLDSVDLVPPRKVVDIHKVYLSSLVLVYLVQFQNSSLLSSPLLSLLIGSVLARCFQRRMKVGPVLARLLKLLLHFYLVFTCGLTWSYLLKKLFVSGDPHFLLQLLQVRFGLNSTRDFVTNFLLCQDGLQNPGQNLFLRLTQTSVLPFYVLVLTVCLLSTLRAVCRRLSGQPVGAGVGLEAGRVGEQPAVVFHVLLTLLLGFLTLLFDGVKYVWTPHVCMFTAFGVCSPDVWMTAFRWIRLKSVHPVVLALILSTAVPTIIGFSLWREFYPQVLAELADLQGFYEPDTVELISWIRSQSPAVAVFAGSPQLLGTLKLCSGSVVTSLPVYTDLQLLRRAEQSLQVYSLRSAEDVYKRLAAQRSSFVVLEESLCEEAPLRRSCSIRDLLDASNQHVVSSSKHGRFCQEIRRNSSPYTNYFSRVFWNRSYHVYRVNAVISFQS